MQKNIAIYRSIETWLEPVPPYRMKDIPDDLRKITPEQWEAMRKVDIRTVDKSQLVDIRTTKIDEKLPPLTDGLAICVKSKTQIVSE